MANDESAALLIPSSSSSIGWQWSLLRSWARWSIKLLIWVVFLVWVVVMFFFPLSYVQNLFEDYITSIQNSTLFGATGSVLIAFTGPLLFIALLAALYVTLSEDDVYDKNSRKKGGPSYSLWTFPVVVNGAVGVITGAEFIGILVFVAAVLYGVTSYTIDSIREASSFQYSNLLKCATILETEGVHLASIGIFCVAFLFIPVARGSVLLRLVNIPFEHAIRYHVWLGHLTVFIFTLHGLSFIIAWAIEGNLLQSLLSWGSNGIAILPGVIALASGLLMWATALHFVRRTFFELFFYTHHLYLVFVVFLVLHVGDYFFAVALGGVLIFMLDRFLRFCQSRKIVDVLSMTRHSCGVVELVISKPTNLRYNAMSFVFINVRELSLLQWHPFSVSSSPMDGDNHLTILAKGLGDWTMKLKDEASSIDHLDDETEQLCQSRVPLTVSIEGPYGHESPYYLMYDSLVLVAGGIGISPFVAILRDMMNRAKDDRSIFPRKVVVVWAIRRWDELSLLPNLDSICPSFSNLIDLEIHVYITRECGPTASLEEAKTCEILNSSIYKNSLSSISPLVGTGDKKWTAIYVSSSIVGFVVILGLLDEYYEDPFNLSSGWYTGLLMLGCMAASVVIIGGIVVAFWHFSAKKDDDNVAQTPNLRENRMTRVEDHINWVTTKYGCRPDFSEIIESMEKKFGRSDVGVIVCGPPSLELSVAKEIRSHSSTRTRNDPIFHFHTHSFQL